MIVASARRAAIYGGMAAAALMAAAAVTWFLWPSGPSGAADPTDLAQVAFGGEIYRERCAVCHGADLEGQLEWKIRKPNGRLPAPPHDETGHTWHHPDEHLFRITKRGLKPPLAPDGYQSDMPAFADVLTDAEIWAALAYIKSRWTPRTRARQPKGTD